MDITELLVMLNTVILAPIWLNLSNLREDIQNIRKMAIQAQIDVSQLKGENYGTRTKSPNNPL